MKGFRIESNSIKESINEPVAEIHLLFVLGIVSERQVVKVRFHLRS